MKENVYYSIKDYNFEGNLLLKAGRKINLVNKIGNSLMFSGDSEGLLSEKIFNSLFSPFQLNQIVYHSFYGIGQIVPSNNKDVSAAVVFFTDPKVQYNIHESGIPVNALQ